MPTLECAAILLVKYQLAWDGGIPTTRMWVTAIIPLFSFITAQTTVGRHFYAVGVNIEAARLSNVNTRKLMYPVGKRPPLRYQTLWEVSEDPKAL